MELSFELTNHWLEAFLIIAAALATIIVLWWAIFKEEEDIKTKRKEVK